MSNTDKKTLEAKQFQKKAADYAYDKLFVKNDSKFLLADEVGLGKTIIAAELMNLMIKKNNSAGCNVLYLCSNIDLANENIDKLKKFAVFSSPETVDRLSLFFNEYISVQNQSGVCRLCGISPKTTNGQSKGNYQEKALAAVLITSLCCKDNDEEDFIKGCLNDTAKKEYSVYLNNKNCFINMFDNPDGFINEYLKNNLADEDEKNDLADEYKKNLKASIKNLKKSVEAKYKEFLTVKDYINRLRELLGIDSSYIRYLHTYFNGHYTDNDNAKHQKNMEDAAMYLKGIADNFEDFNINQRVADSKTKLKGLEKYQFISKWIYTKNGVKYNWYSNLNELIDKYNTIVTKETLYNIVSIIKDNPVKRPDQVREEVKVSEFVTYINELCTIVGKKDDNRALPYQGCPSFFNLYKLSFFEYISDIKAKMTDLSISIIRNAYNRTSNKDTVLVIADEIQNYFNEFKDTITPAETEDDKAAKTKKGKAAKTEDENAAKTALQQLTETKMLILSATPFTYNIHSVKDDPLENRTDFHDVMDFVCKGAANGWDKDKWNDLANDKQSILDAYNDSNFASTLTEYTNCISEQQKLLKGANISRTERTTAGGDFFRTADTTVTPSFEDFRTFGWSDGCFCSINSIDDGEFDDGEFDDGEFDDGDEASRKNIRIGFIKSTPAMLSFKEKDDGVYESIKDITEEGTYHFTINDDWIKNKEKIFADGRIHHSRFEALLEKVFGDENGDEILFVPPSKIRNKTNPPPNYGFSKRLYFSDYDMTTYSLSRLLSYEVYRRSYDKLIKANADMIVAGKDWGHILDLLDKAKLYEITKTSCNYFFSPEFFDTLELDKTFEDLYTNGSIHHYLSDRNIPSEIGEQKPQKHLHTLIIRYIYINFMQPISAMFLLRYYCEKCSEFNGDVNNLVDNTSQWFGVFSSDEKDLIRILLKLTIAMWHYCSKNNFYDVLDEYIYRITGKYPGNDPLDGNDYLEIYKAFEKLNDFLKKSLINDKAPRNNDSLDSLICSYAVAHKDGGAIRDAFNSPFFPFHYVSTSAGQEGFDFHHYCRKIVHWGLTPNPIKLEQREGRINRYNGYCTRLNVCKDHPGLNCREAFAKVESRPGFDACNGLAPHWVYTPADEGKAFKLERETYYYKYSYESENFDDVVKNIGSYRALLGQPESETFENQFKKFIANVSPDKKRDCFIDLSPPDTP